MRLYTYDHCPFCVRARMPFGLFKISFELMVLPNDDENTPIGMIGAKQVPVLQKPDGSYMGESLDIVRWLANYANQPPLSEDIRPELQIWIDKESKYHNKLIWPRCVQLSLPEFATQSAIDYFKNKKESIIGNFDNCLNETPALLEQLHRDLNELEALTLPHDISMDKISMEDIILFPILRNLTMVHGLVFPEKLKKYVINMSKASDIPLYFDRSI